MSVSLRRGAVGLALASALVAALSPAVHADNLEANGVELEGNDQVALGVVCAGDQATTATTFQLLRAGNVNANVWDKSTTVTITPAAAATSERGVLTLGSTSATTPSTWLDSQSQAAVASAPASVDLAVPAAAPAGEASVTVRYTATGKAAVAGDPISRTDDVTFTWTVEDCAPSDSSPPEISYVLDPVNPDGENGWYTTDVSIDWTVTDPESDVILDGCQDETFTSDGTFAPTCSATSAGGTAEQVVASVKRDSTAPEVAFTGGPADGAEYYYGDPIPTSTCEATDATSEVDEDGCIVTGGGTTVGDHELTATATDNAGNETAITRGYAVLPWTLEGFYKPVSVGTAVVNTVKAGSTVPLKFNVHKGDTALTSDIGAIFSAKKVGCDGTDVANAVEEFVATGSTSLRYDAAGAQWVQNWATPSGGKGSCYRVTMTTADGSAILADFKLK